jgi:hypothetical protein
MKYDDEAYKLKGMKAKLNCPERYACQDADRRGGCSRGGFEPGGRYLTFISP